MKTLNQLAGLRMFLLRLRRRWLSLRHGVTMHPTATMSLSGRTISGGRGSIVIGADTLVAFKTLLISRDDRGSVAPVRIGARCFIGGGSIVMPGVTIGDECIVAAGAVVFADVTPRSIVAGNPARVLRTGIDVGARGRLKGFDHDESFLLH